MEIAMRRALVLSVVLVSGCQQAPPAADPSGQNAVKANKEVSDLLRKADALAATTDTPPVSGSEPVLHPSVSAAAFVAAPLDPPRVTPAKPKADGMRDQAAAALGDRLSALRRTAEASRLKKDRHLQVCQGKVATSECQLLTADIADATRTLERELGDIEEAAQRAGIDPGLMHDLLAKYGF
jgi:hypothetical protein